MRRLSVMQHYEIPTRLLDRTTNFWTAIYFACASDPGANAELWYYDRVIFQKQRERDNSLHAFVDRSSDPALEPAFRHRRDENLLVEIDPQISLRMRQQSAHHTASTGVFSDHAPALIALQNEIGVTEPARRLVHRVIIDGACKSKALQFLAEPPLKITASTIFPDVVGLGRFLRWQFDTLRTMLLGCLTPPTAPPPPATPSTASPARPAIPQAARESG
ncbi:MAG: FRG domain-containing protein, partial [Bryobacteraceae bacterium]|nr:FRG domain-containing protein [Bryobacteraceae bacterium]